jgi:hypothetical protein
MVDFSTAVSSRYYYGSTGRPPAGGASAATYYDLSVWQVVERLHIVLWLGNSRGEMRDSDARDFGL